MDRQTEQITESYLAPPACGDLPPALAEHPRYKVLKVLGQGGMGTVYLAEHRKMERQVALKVIHPKLLQDGSAIERFQREVKAAAKLHHPNIVLAYDADEAGEEPKLHFLAMEFVAGQNLADYLKQHGKVQVTEACHYVRQAALGLQHAYEQGMVHRDIKPHNLLRLPSGHIKILDFGLAKFVRQQTNLEPQGQLTATGMILGTVDYLAPEQAGNSQGADIRADIYSLGCTLYQLLSGQLPFPEGTLGEKLSKHAQETPRSLSTFRTDMPPGLETVLSRMMAKRPEDRYQTPAEVAVALAPFSGDAVSLASATMALPATAPVAQLVGEPKNKRWFFFRPPWWELMVCAVGLVMCLVPYSSAGNRGLWGVERGDDDPWGTKNGVTLSEVTPDSPAALLGLREGMVIRSVNGIPVKEISQLRRLLGHLKPGDPITVQIGDANLHINLTATAPANEVTPSGYMVWSFFAGAAFSILGLLLLMRETTRPSPWWRIALVFIVGFIVVLAVPLSIVGRGWALVWEPLSNTAYYYRPWTDGIAWQAFVAMGCGVALLLLGAWEIRLRGQREQA